eukprot:2015762-Amphidinium_carterae.1
MTRVKRRKPLDALVMEADVQVCNSLSLLAQGNGQQRLQTGDPRGSQLKACGLGNTVHVEVRLPIQVDTSLLSLSEPNKESNVKAFPPKNGHPKMIKNAE